MSDLILASGSAIRASLMRNCGLDFTVERPRVDEEAVKAGLRAEGLRPRDQADALAEVKAVSVSRVRPGALVIGADQMLALEDDVLDKPADRAGAREHLRRLSGRSHHLMCAAVAARDGIAIWRHVETPRLTVRPLTDDFIESYLDVIGDAAFASVGAYQLEAHGAHLFSRVDGDYFSILGLPLLPLLAFLRSHGAAPA
jgi:septum formation protein